MISAWRRRRARHRQLVRLLDETGWRCCFCRCRLDLMSATREHMTPKSLGGCDATRNLTVSCDTCNTLRGSKDFYAFEARTRKRPEYEAPPHRLRTLPARAMRLLGIES
jgi:5-methylcytosine-specific restriction endonuclease McrA